MELLELEREDYRALNDKYLKLLKENQLASKDVKEVIYLKEAEMRQVVAEKDRAITQLTKQIQELQEKIAAQTKELDAARKDLSDESVSKERQLNVMLEQIKTVNFESIQHQKTFAYEKQQIEIKYAK